MDSRSAVGAATLSSSTPRGTGGRPETMNSQDCRQRNARQVCNNISTVATTIIALDSTTTWRGASISSRMGAMAKAMPKPTALKTNDPSSNAARMTASSQPKSIRAG